MTDLEKMPKGKLAKTIEAAQTKCDKAADKIFAQALHGQERFSEIKARLGKSHKDVIAHDLACRQVLDLHLECRRRYGQAVTFNSMWPTFLRVRG